MAASAHPSGGGGGNSNNNNSNNRNPNSNGNNGNSNGHNGNNNSVNGGNSNGISVPDNSVVGPTQAALRHNPGLSVEWTADEQSLLEDLLAEYASETNMVRYAKIAIRLQDKTVRDVALRCRWMSKKEIGKRRKEDHNSSRKSKDKKEKVTDSFPKSNQIINRSNGPPYAQPMMSMDIDDGVSFQAIGGATGQLLEQSAHALDQISANFASYKMHENIPLLCQARNSILSILNDFNDMPEIMRQMPPLPVKLNEELANTILPRTSLPNRP